MAALRAIGRLLKFLWTAASVLVLIAVVLFILWWIATL